MDWSTGTAYIKVVTGASMQIYNFFVLYYIVYIYQLEISYQIFDIGDLID